ncbi:MOSC domain-containing protein [Actinacidiphila acididurans]|uniref:MOSC domain-containing protein n=1 Tax=Actinacidiphila acididurans TaxID=2784346 RepID=A0ABS2TQE6_9ACTN|nr:MOSC domain-containing protein [Actinacidiphila acididurans]MBM9504731.1 MOSC domain-containing protein [Actinacidiphila acididurans]
MTAQAFVSSVNIGHPRPNPWKGLAATGIDKRPVAGPVRVSAPGPKGTGAVGLAGDRAYDVRNHGGADQAVYAYAREDLDIWERELGREFGAGSFGENLTTTGIDVNSALIGERWRIGGGLVLEVSCPRIPCVTFAGWLGERGWLRTFTRAARPGPYLRVIEPGEVAPGDRIEVVGRPDHEVTVAVSFRALTTEPELLPLLVDVEALPAEDRAAVRRRLERGARP